MAKSYPDIGTFTSGQILTAATMNDVGTNLDNLRVPPACRAYVSDTINVNDNTNTVVDFSSEDFDTDGMHSISTNKSRITVNTAGIYIVTGVVAYTTTIDLDVAPFLRLNGSTEVARSGAATGGHGASVITVIIQAAVNDYYELVVYQNNSANTARTLAGNTSLQMAWIGQAS